jgi:hypothetical protein
LTKFSCSLKKRGDAVESGITATRFQKRLALADASFKSKNENVESLCDCNVREAHAGPTPDALKRASGVGGLRRQRAFAVLSSLMRP